MKQITQRITVIMMAIGIAGCGGSLKAYKEPSGMSSYAVLSIDGSSSKRSFASQKHSVVHVHTVSKGCIDGEYLGAIWSSSNKSSNTIKIPANRKLNLRLERNTVYSHSGYVTSLGRSLFFVPQKNVAYIVKVDESMKDFIDFKLLKKKGNSLARVKSEKNCSTF